MERLLKNLQQLLVGISIMQVSCRLPACLSPHTWVSGSSELALRMGRGQQLPYQHPHPKSGRHGMLKRDLCSGTPVWVASRLTSLPFDLNHIPTQLPCDPLTRLAATGPDSEGARQPGVIWRAAVHPAFCSAAQLPGLLSSQSAHLPNLVRRSASL
jgi:hypothetical protein